MLGLFPLSLSFWAIDYSIWYQTLTCLFDVSEFTCIFDSQIICIASIDHCSFLLRINKSSSR